MRSGRDSPAEDGSLAFVGRSEKPYVRHADPMAVASGVDQSTERTDWIEIATPRVALANEFRKRSGVGRRQESVWRESRVRWGRGNSATHDDYGKRGDSDTFERTSD